MAQPPLCLLPRRAVRSGLGGRTGAAVALALLLGGPTPPAAAQAAAPLADRPADPSADVSAPASAPAAAPPPQRPPLQILLELRRRQISLLQGRQLIGRWPVAIGDPSTPTPTGRFTVLNKVVNPQYESTRSGKRNATIGPQGPLGDRWIGFKRSGANQYGIHGTPDAWSWTVLSRAAVSNGCVRMLTPHIRQLFDQVDVGTPVIVQP